MFAETEEMAQTGILIAIIQSIMVRGDNWGTTNSIAREVEIESVIAEAKPEQKAEKVKDLQVYNQHLGFSSIYNLPNCDFFGILV